MSENNDYKNEKDKLDKKLDELVKNMVIVNSKETFPETPYIISRTPINVGGDIGKDEKKFFTDPYTDHVNTRFIKSDRSRKTIDVRDYIFVSEGSVGIYPTDDPLHDFKESKRIKENIKKFNLDISPGYDPYGHNDIIVIYTKDFSYLTFKVR